MTFEIALLLAIATVTLVLLALEWVSADVVALAMMTALAFAIFAIAILLVPRLWPLR
jgi:hypothetical protein